MTRSATIPPMAPRGGARPGAGRKALPPDQKLETTFVRLPLEMKAAALAAADADGDDLSTWIRGAVRERLARLAKKRAKP